MRSSGPCIVCGYRTGWKCRPFGVITEPVWAHDHHPDDLIQRRWMEANAGGTLSAFLVTLG